MEFTVEEVVREGNFYRAFIARTDSQGTWGLQDLLPQMIKASKKNKRFKLTNDFSISDDKKGVYADMALLHTEEPHKKRLVITDYGVGEKVINMYIDSLRCATA